MKQISSAAHDCSMTHCTLLQDATQIEHKIVKLSYGHKPPEHRCTLLQELQMRRVVSRTYQSMAIAYNNEKHRGQQQQTAELSMKSIVVHTLPPQWWDEGGGS